MKIRLFLSLFFIGAIFSWGWASDELDKQFHRYLLNHPQFEKVKQFIEAGANIEVANSYGFGYQQKKGFTPLIRMAEVNDLAAVRYLLNKGANVNAQDERGRSALMLAAGNKNLEMCKLLVAKGADVNLKGGEGVSALSFAFHAQEVPVIEFLLSKGASWNTNWYVSDNLIFTLLEMPDPIYWVKRGLQNGVNPNGRNEVWGSPLSAVFRKRQLGTKKQEELAQLLIDAGANVNEKGFGSKTEASLAGIELGLGNVQWTSLLLKNGADPNGKTTNGQYFLEKALTYPYWDMVDLLVQKGANVNLSSSVEGVTPLMLAANPFDKCERVLHNVKLLVDAGAKTQAKDIYGKSVLNKLFAWSIDVVPGEIVRTRPFDHSPSCLAVADYLLEHGAPINDVDNEGYSLLDHVEYFNAKRVSPEDIEFLKKHGAKHTLRGRWWRIKQYFKR